jgi:hypothetical protein
MNKYKDVFDTTDENSYNLTIERLKSSKEESKIVETIKMPDKCSYDAIFINSSREELQVEIKDRTINYKTKQPQYTYTYPTVMFEVDKYNKLIKETKHPVYCATYTDGVILYDLKKMNNLYKEEIEENVNEAKQALQEGKTSYSNKWATIKPTPRKTVLNQTKIHQVKLQFPIPKKEENFKNNISKIYFSNK